MFSELGFNKSYFWTNKEVLKLFDIYTKLPVICQAFSQFMTPLSKINISFTLFCLKRVIASYMLYLLTFWPQVVRSMTEHVCMVIVLCFHVSVLNSLHYYRMVIQITEIIQTKM